MRLQLRLYVTADSPGSSRAERTVRRLCNALGAGACDLEVVDVRQRPELAEQDRILATPALIKTDPLPVRKIIGDLSDRAELLDRLELPDDFQPDPTPS